MARKRPPLKIPTPKRPALRITTRKRLPLTRFQKIVFTVAPLVLIPIMVVGVLTESRGESDTSATTSQTLQTGQSRQTAAPAPAEPESSPPPEPAKPEPSGSADQSEVQDDEQEDEPREYDETHLQFGQTAHFTSTAGSSSTPLEFTVSAPTRFKLSKDATLLDANATTVIEGERQPTSVYFTVTVKNTSKDQSWDADFLFSDVTETGEDDVVSEVRDGDVSSVSFITDGGQDIGPGDSATVKDGYSVKSADRIEYKLSVDGLAGRSFYFTR